MLRAVGGVLFRGKRSTFLWLRWLHIIALSYMMLFHTGSLHVSSQAALLIIVVICSNAALMFLPKTYFDVSWFDRLLIGADVVVVSMAMWITEFSSQYLLVFYFLLILMMTIGRGSQTALINGLVVVGIYLAVLVHEHGLSLLDRPSILFEIPFLIICCVFFSVMVHMEYVRRREAVQLADEEIGRLETELERRARDLSAGKLVDDQRTMEHAALIWRLEAQAQELLSSREALLGNEQRLFQFMDHVSFGVHVLDADGKTYFANRMAIELLGSAIIEQAGVEELVGAYQARLVGTDQPYPADRMPAVRALRGQRSTVMDLEVGGAVRPIPLLVSASPILDDDGRVQFAIVALQEITEQRRLEMQLRQAQKMEAVGRLAGGVAHDFNNILTAIFGFGRFVKDSLHPLDPAYEDMQELLEAAKRAQELTGQLLAFSRQQTVRPRALNPAVLVGHIDRMLRRIVGDDVELLVDCADDVGNVTIDPGAFEQVLVNLAVNARDAMPTGGKLTISTSNVQLDEERTTEGGVTIAPGQYVIVSVSDSGMGMDEATRARVFEPFFTTKGPDAGTGLGLSTCYGIVKQANGVILVHSQPGQGATFEVYLPTTDLQVQEARVVVKQSVLDGSETVLVVEDDQVVRKLAVRALQKYGYSALAVDSGSAALGLYDRLGERIDLLMTDIVMPSMSGTALAQQLTDRQPDIKVLYISGYNQAAAAAHGFLAEGSALLHKPFTPELLVGRVRDVLDTQPDGAKTAASPTPALLVDDEPSAHRSIEA